MQDKGVFCHGNQFGRPGSSRTGSGSATRNAGRKRNGTGCTRISALASGNGFSKYSGETASAGRNRPRFAIQAHCGLLVTSVSPNCCLLNGILRKSHFPAQSNRNPWAACLVPLPPSVAGGASNPPCPGFPKLISIPPLASLYKLKYSKLK